MVCYRTPIREFLISAYLYKPWSYISYSLGGFSLAWIRREGTKAHCLNYSTDVLLWVYQNWNVNKALGSIQYQVCSGLLQITYTPPQHGVQAYRQFHLTIIQTEFLFLWCWGLSKPFHMNHCLVCYPGTG